MKKKKFKKFIILLLFIIIVAIEDYFNIEENNKTENIIKNNEVSYKIIDVPEYNEQSYIEINNNIPEFTEEDFKLEADYYSDLENERVRNSYDKSFLEKSKSR